MLIHISALLLIVLPVAFSAPTTPSVGALTSLSSIQSSTFPAIASKFSQTCQVSGIAVPLTGKAALGVPAGAKTSKIAVGRGNQNYTCTGGTYMSAGAVANLYDVSCVFSMTSAFIKPDQLSSMLPDIVIKTLSFPDSSRLPVAIKHFFTNTPGSAVAGAISPVFASASEKVIVKKLASLNDTANPTVNVPWLQLGALDGQGTLANSVFRINTVRGQPPASCSIEGEQLTVAYASIYWFTK